MFLLHDIFDWQARHDPGAEIARDTIRPDPHPPELGARANRIANALRSGRARSG